MPHFTHYISIDYSGAETAESSCKGIRVYVAEGPGTPEPARRRMCRRHLTGDLKENVIQLVVKNRPERHY